MELLTQKNNLGHLTQNLYDVWDLCPAPSSITHICVFLKNIIIKLPDVAQSVILLLLKLEKSVTSKKIWSKSKFRLDLYLNGDLVSGTLCARDLMS